MTDANLTTVWNDGDAYERFMGRWSRLAGKEFLDWLALPKHLRWLDVGNDWIAFPDGDEYIAKLRNLSPQLLNELGTLRLQHLQAVADLLDAIEKGKLGIYLNHQFRCPEGPGAGEAQRWASEGASW
jgi:hypothetical protein